MEKSLELYILGSNSSGASMDASNPDYKLNFYLGALSEMKFPNTNANDTQIRIGSFTYQAVRMGGAPTITATFQYPRILDDDFNYYNTKGSDTFSPDDISRSYVYTYFNGEKYYALDIPTRTKSNSNIGYTYDVTFYSEREVLNHIYFIDAVQPDVVIDEIKTNSLKVVFWGDVNEFAKRLNYSLEWSGAGGESSENGYKVIVDTDVESEEKNVSLEDTYIASALQEIYNLFEIPYYFVGKEIHIGFVQDGHDILKPIRYGSKNELISVKRESANNLIINRATGVGSSDNIPFYYPNPTPRGTLGVSIFSKPSGSTITDDNFEIIDPLKFYEKVNLSDKVTFHSDSPDSSKNWTISSNTEEYYSIGELGLSQRLNPPDGLVLQQKRLKYVTPQTNLMPPIYRETDGKEMFYDAINNIYEIDGHKVLFNNVYDSTNPLEGKGTFEDIKPTIEGMTNSQFEPIDQFVEFAYDEKDSDDKDEDGNYIHPYFFAKMHKTFGEKSEFNLFALAIEDQEMQISFTTGILGGCTFRIMVSDDTQKNIVMVDDNGNLLRDEDGNVRFGIGTDLSYARQNNTINNEVWIALEKEDNTYGHVMPNNTYAYKPTSNDKFVILGINLPQGYILSAEERLKQAIIQYMLENNDTRFNFSIDFSRVFLAQNPDFLNSLNENTRLILDYNEENIEQHLVTLYVSDFSYKMENNQALPEISVSLSDSFSASQSTLQNALNSIRDEIMLTVSGTQSYLMNWARYNFLSKRLDDTAAGYITFNKGIHSKDNSTFDKDVEITGKVTITGDTTVNGELTSNKKTNLVGPTDVTGEMVVKDNRIRFGDSFVGGLFGKGGYIDKDARAELRSLRLWEWLEVPELRYNRVTAYTGIRWDTVGAGIIETVTPNSDGKSGSVTLKLENGEIGMIGEYDLCMGIWHDTSGNASSSSDDHKGNFSFAGFKTVYFQITDIPSTDAEGKSNSDQHYFLYTLRDGYTVHPFSQMNFATRGNTSNENRQSFTYTTTEYSLMLSDVNQWEFTENMYKAISGKLEGFVLNGKTFHGYGTVLGNAYIYGQIDQFEKIAHEMRITDSLGGLMQEGETDTLYCAVYDGYNQNVTAQYSNWRIIRTTANAQEDETWNASAGTPSLDTSGDGAIAKYSISYSDLGSGETAQFTFSAQNIDGTILSRSTSFG